MKQPKTKPSLIDHTPARHENEINSLNILYFLNFSGSVCQVEIPIEAPKEEEVEAGSESKDDASKHGGDDAKDDLKTSSKRRRRGANPGSKLRTKIVQDYCDIIGDDFWTDNPHILGPFAES